MKSFLIDYIDRYGYPDDVVIRAYTEQEATIQFYQEHSGCKIKRIS